MSLILGVKIDEINRPEALNRVSIFLQSGQHAIFTPNPEMVVKAQKDEYFKQVLNSGDLNLCDGFGLWAAVRLSRRHGGSLPAAGWSPQGDRGGLANTQPTPPCPPARGDFERIPGIDFMLEICSIAAEEGRSVYLLGSWSEEVAKKTKENLEKQFPNLKIVGWNKGPKINEISDIKYRILNSDQKISNIQYPISSNLEIFETENQKLIDSINTSQAEIVFVAFGMGKQEKWIYENLSKLPSVHIAMGVGGAFDYISGKVPRAPRLMRKIGLEWMYRLLAQPTRLRRILNATAKFIWLILWKK